MKCPKCAYVGFEESDRCRHCGYDFSLIEPAPAAAAAPSLRAVESPRPTSYREPSRPAAGEAALMRDEATPLVDLPLGGPSPPASASAAATAAGAAPPTLPPSLFADPQPPPARTPLAVRRTADRPRSRATPHVVRRPRPALLETSADDASTDAEAVADVAPEAAPPIARVLSVGVDVALLAGIDAAVVYLTAQIAGVPMGQVMSLPLVPLAAFILGLNIAYLAVFTANGGQTLGKMATGLRVEATDGALTFGGAIVRVAAALVGGLVVGAGFIPALFRADRRAVHDQIAHTRVVKVSA